MKLKNHVRQPSRYSEFRHSSQRRTDQLTSYHHELLRYKPTRPRTHQDLPTPPTTHSHCNRQINRLQLNLNQVSLLESVNLIKKELQSQRKILHQLKTPNLPTVTPTRHSVTQKSIAKKFYFPKQKKGVRKFKRAVKAIILAIRIRKVIMLKVTFKRKVTERQFKRNAMSVTEQMLKRLVEHIQPHLDVYFQLVKQKPSFQTIKSFISNLIQTLIEFRPNSQELRLMALFASPGSSLISDLLTHYEFLRLTINSPLRQNSHSTTPAQTNMLVQTFIFIRLLCRYVLVRPWNLNATLDRPTVFYNARMFSSVFYAICMQPWQELQEQTISKPLIRLKSFLPFKNEIQRPTAGVILGGIDPKIIQSFVKQNRSWLDQQSQRLGGWSRQVGERVRRIANSLHRQWIKTFLRQ